MSSRGVSVPDAGAPKPGQEQKNLSRGGQKMRWCPETGAGAKKLARVGQKMRWCPRIGAGAKKLSTPLL
ncbi:MAG: hypothetical protein QM296_09315 [Bacillota bacterium]|nr:hypothetical protein [Bacillota bacterium]